MPTGAKVNNTISTCTCIISIEGVYSSEWNNSRNEV